MEFDPKQRNPKPPLNKEFPLQVVNKNDYSNSIYFDRIIDKELPKLEKVFGTGPINPLRKKINDWMNEILFVVFLAILF